MEILAKYTHGIPGAVLLRRACLICLLAILVVPNIAAQRSPERASIFGIGGILGLNASQIDGDNFSGYDKFGFLIGLRGITRINDKVEVHLDLLFTQRGSRFESVASFAEGRRDRAIELNYAEVPMMIVYKFDRNPNGARFMVEGGLSYSRLLKTRIVTPAFANNEEFPYTDIEEDFNSTDLSLVFGAGYLPIDQIAIGIRYTGSLNKFYENPDPSVSRTGENVLFLRNYYLSAFAAYFF